MSVVYHNEFVQGSEEWLNFRKDKITATGAYKLLQGQSIEDILEEKKHEKPFFGNKYTERGKLLEGEARKLFSDLTNQEITEVGIITNDKYPDYACSPDGLIDSEDAGLEIKCFSEKHHLQVMEELDPEIYCQIQFNLFLTERKKWYFFAYNPEVSDISLVYYKQTILPDEEMFEKFRQAVKPKTSNNEVANLSLQIIELDTQLQSQPEEIKRAIEQYIQNKNRIAELKQKLKDSTTGRIKHTYSDDFDNKLDISIYDTNRVVIEDICQIPKEFIISQEDTDAYIGEDGKIYHDIADTKSVSNLLKTGKSLPPGFKVSTSRSISIKFNGETL